MNFIKTTPQRSEESATNVSCKGKTLPRFTPPASAGRIACEVSGEPILQSRR